MTVYPSFNSDLHAQRGLQAIQGLPIYLAWDFGLTPACLVVQMTPMGTILVLKEYFVEGMAIKSFAESVVLPGLKIDFPYNKIGLSIADPAGAFRSEQIDDLSCIGILNMLGIETRPARTNDIAPRLGAVNYFLNKLIDGKPAFVVDIDKCPLLYKGFIKGYLFKRIAIIGEERYKDVPDKNKYSHTHDCCQYICLELASTMIQKEKQVEHDFTQYSTLPPQVF